MSFLRSTIDWMIVIEIEPATLPTVSIKPAISPALKKEFALTSEMTFVMMEEQQVSTDRANPSTRQDPAMKSPYGWRLAGEYWILMNKATDNNYQKLIEDLILAQVFDEKLLNEYLKLL